MRQKTLLLSHATAIRRMVLIGGCWLLLMIFGLPPGRAQTSEPGVVDLSFARLGEATFELVAPDRETVSFSLPFRWHVNSDDSYIELHYDVIWTDPAPGGVTAQDSTTLTVYLDDNLLTTFSPRPDQDQTLQLPIPAEAVADPENNNHQLFFILQQDDCRAAAMRLVIHGDSLVHLEYDTRPLTANLAEFPRPFLEDQLPPETVLLLIPDDYNEADLTAAATVAATFGQEADDEVVVTLSTPAGSTPAQLEEQNIIAIGRPDRNAITADLYQRDLLPTTLATDGVTLVDPDNEPIPAGDGVLQAILSPDSPDHVYLTVTGGGDGAVIQAARALSAGGPEFGSQGDLAVVTAIQETAAANPILPERFTLAAIGFRDITWTGIGRHSTSNNFTIPANWTIEEHGTLTFTYIFSEALDRDRSSVRVELNGNLVGTAVLADAPAGENELTIRLPPGDLHPGDSNRLGFEADLVLDQPCPPPDAPQAWLRLRNNGVVALPHDIRPDDRPAANTPFVTRPDLSDVLFVLPAAPSDEDLYSLVQLAVMLGDAAEGAALAPQVRLSPVADSDSLAGHQVMAIGRPTANDFIAVYNTQLPQPFVPAGDSLSQTAGALVYRVPETFSLGVLEHLPAPWDPAQPFVIISGTTDEGVRWAVDALTRGELGGELSGNVTFVHDAFVESFTWLSGEAQIGLATTLDTIPGALEVATATPGATDGADTPGATRADIPAGSIPDRYQPAGRGASPAVTTLILGLFGAGILIIVGGVLWTRRQNQGDDGS